ncbi:MAG: hypothetical protein U0694_16680 [Anaerolineae bacterium]
MAVSPLSTTSVTPSAFGQLYERRFIGEAEKRGDTYLMTRTVADTVLFGGRSILAYNRILYPYHKWLTRAIAAKRQEKPDNLHRAHRRAAPQSQQGHDGAYLDSIKNFRDWGVRFLKRWSTSPATANVTGAAAAPRRLVNKNRDTIGCPYDMPTSAGRSVQPTAFLFISAARHLLRRPSSSARLIQTITTR